MILLIGHLSTKGTLLSLIHILAKRPDIQKSIQSEIDNVIGVDREPVLADRQHCPLVTAVILETLRYISHLPIVTHNTSKPTHIDGIPVERNTTVSQFVYFDYSIDKIYSMYKAHIYCAPV